MTQEAKHFVLGLAHSRAEGGMTWHGTIPDEIRELFQLPTDFKGGYLLGIYVQVKPQYLPFTPTWSPPEALTTSWGKDV